MDNYKIYINPDNYQSFDVMLPGLDMRMTMRYSWVCEAWLFDMETTDWSVFGRQLTNYTNLLSHTPNTGTLILIGQPVDEFNLGIENELFYSEGGN